MADFPIVPERTAMLFFDTLNGYLHPADPEANAAVVASGIIPKIQQIYAACREAGIAIFYGQADHRRDGKDWPVTVVGEPPRLITFGGTNYAGPHHAAIVDELPALPVDYVIKKHRWSTFHQTHLELSLRTAGIDTIILAGGATEVGIASTAYSARDHDYGIIVLSDACNAIRPGVNELFLTRVFPRMARVMTTAQAISLIA